MLWTESKRLKRMVVRDAGNWELGECVGIDFYAWLVSAEISFTVDSIGDGRRYKRGGRGKSGGAGWGEGGGGDRQTAKTKDWGGGWGVGERKRER